ncbi:hypothetical protein Salat_1682600, partial [Sesamum alatum]
EFVNLAERVLNTGNDKSLDAIVALAARWVVKYVNNQRGVSPLATSTNPADGRLVGSQHYACAEGTTSAADSLPVEHCTARVPLNPSQEHEAQRPTPKLFVGRQVIPRPLRVYVSKSTGDEGWSPRQQHCTASPRHEASEASPSSPDRWSKGKEIVVYNKFNILQSDVEEVEASPTVIGPLARWHMTKARGGFVLSEQEDIVDELVNWYAGLLGGT